MVGVVWLAGWLSGVDENIGLPATTLERRGTESAGVELRQCLLCTEPHEGGGAEGGGYVADDGVKGEKLNSRNGLEVRGNIYI